MSLALGRETSDMVPVGPAYMADALVIELLCGPLNIQMDKDRSSDWDRSYLSGQEKTIIEDLWVSTAFQYQPRQQQLQRLPRLLFAVLDVAVAVVEVVADAVDVVVAAVVVAVAEHGLGLGRREPEALVHENHDLGGPALWLLAFGCCEDLVGWDSPPNSPGRFVGTVVRRRSILASMMEAIHFVELRCTFAVWDAVGQTQPLTYRPCWVLATAGQQPTAGAGLATRAPPHLETDGDKPDRILGSPRLKALAVFCQIDDTAPRLPTDGRCCLRWSSKTNLLLMFFH